jgi:hypothetical protein
MGGSAAVHGAVPSKDSALLADDSSPWALRIVTRSSGRRALQWPVAVATLVEARRVSASSQASWPSSALA